MRDKTVLNVSLRNGSDLMLSAFESEFKDLSSCVVTWQRIELGNRSLCCPVCLRLKNTSWFNLEEDDLYYQRQSLISFALLLVGFWRLNPNVCFSFLVVVILRLTCIDLSVSYIMQMTTTYDKVNQSELDLFSSPRENTNQRACSIYSSVTKQSIPTF